MVWDGVGLAGWGRMFFEVGSQDEVEGEGEKKKKK